MALLRLNASACVRNLVKASTCRSCVDICPTKAIDILEGGLDATIPALNLSKCVGCAGCVSICPSSALSVEEFDATTFFFSFMKENTKNTLSCQDNVPCLASLNVEQLLALSVFKKELHLDGAHCESCDIAHTCKPFIDKSVEEVEYLLSAMDSTAKIQIKDLNIISEQIPQEQNRRDFFNAFHLKNAIKSKKDFEDRVESSTDEFIAHNLNAEKVKEIRAKSDLSDRKKLFFTAIKRVDVPEQFHVVDAKEVTFTSQKLIDKELCTACQMCYRICPTKALKSDGKNSKIDFDAFLCIKCASCIDVCEPKAIYSSDSFNIKEFFAPSIQRLITYDVKRCNECTAFFTSIQGSEVCHRCQAEEDDAKELWGL
ncbi:MAG: 4Fe-4S dicluster domain-containing protein [Helicobacteraceae bacterium]|nr:4Fe-4S dicluster domain-containing protein [Helicobacteraceae bacterium]